MAGWAAEAQTRRIVWPEWSGDIVDKFMQWLYTDDYDIPYPTEARNVAEKQETAEQDGELNELEKVDPTSTNEDFPYELQEEEWGAPVEPEAVLAPPPEAALEPQPASGSEERPIASTARKFRKKRTKDPLKTKDSMKSKGPLTPLEDLKWKGCHAIKIKSRAEEFDSWMQGHRKQPKPLDYGATFITHATLYVIACQKDLIELKNMAWQRLRALLVAIGPPVPGWPIVADLVGLIQYTYRETGISELKKEPLRELLTSYVAIHFTSFEGPEVDNLFSSTVSDDREFVVELMSKVRQRMENLEANDAGQPVLQGHRVFSTFG